MNRLMILLTAVALVWMAGQAAAGINDGLIGYWPFSGEASDQTANGHDGIVYGATLTPDRNGQADSAYYLGGYGGYATGAHISVAHDPVLNVQAGQDLTIAFWVNQEETGDYQILLAKGRDSYSSYYFTRLPNSTDVSFVIRKVDMGPVDEVTAEVPLGEWHHVTGVVDNTNGEIRFYLDGELLDQQAISPELSPFSTSNDYPLVFGRNYVNPDGSGGFEYPFMGKMDEVRLYDRVLSSDEIAALTDGLVHHWSFDETSGDAVDAIGDADGTLGNVNRTYGLIGAGAIELTGGDDSFVDFGAQVGQFGKDDFTVSFWLNTAETQELFDLLGNHKASSCGTDFSMRMTGEHPTDPHGAITAGVSQWDCVNAIFLQSGPGFHDGLWHHVAAVRQGATLTLYVDGAEEASGSPEPANWVGDGIADIVNGDPFKIGRSLVYAPALNFTPVAAFDDLRIYDHALSASEVQDAFEVASRIVAVPELTATYNQAITVPISIEDAGSLIAAEVFLEYDTSLLTFTGVSVAGTLTDGWSVETNTEAGSGSLETLKIAAATDQSSITGTQTLVDVHFTVKDVRVPASSPLTLTHVLLNDGTPPNTAVSGSVTLIGNDGTIAVDPAQIVPRQILTLTVVDPDADLDGSAETDQVTVTATNGYQTETLLLDETATPGEFTGTIATAFSLASTAVASSGDAILQAKADDILTVAFVDQLDDEGNGPFDRTAQTDVLGGIDGTVEISIASQPGDDVYIKVIDLDISAPPADYMLAASSIDVEVASTTLDVLTVTLTETAPSSGIFVGTLATTPGAEAGQMTTAEDDVLTVTYVDDLAADGEPQVDRTGANQVLDPWGDADDNEQLQAFDAALTLLEVLVPSTLNGLEELAANVDEDPVGTGINPYDASLILQHRVGLIASFPVQDAASTNHPQPNPASPKGTPQVRSLALRAGDGYLSVWAEERDRIVSGDLLLEGVDGQAALGDELGDFLLASRSTDEGLRIVFAGAAAIAGPGELLRVYGVGSAGARLTRAAFNNGRLEGQTSGELVGSVPASFGLHANAPNPFNPETAIRYDVPAAGPVSLRIYDVTGQVVRSLVDVSQPAGRYSAVWDGRSESGHKVANGVYLYELRAGDFRAVRKMVLAK